MKTRHKIFGALLALTMIAGFSLWTFQAPIGLAAMNMAVRHFAGRDSLADLPDGLHLVLCGSGSPVPDPGRAGPCSLVIAGDQIFVVDAGEGGSRSIARMGIATQNIRALLLTHFHSDHIDGLGSLLTLRWNATSAAQPLPVLGPSGVEQVVAGFRLAYSLDNQYRIAHLGPRLAPPAGAQAEARPFVPPILNHPTGTEIWNRDGLTITAFSVDHEPVSPAVGYRFEYKGRSVVLSGDTTPSASLARAARGADILVHEALQPELLQAMAAALEDKGLDRNAKIMRKVLAYHSSPAQAADTARAAQVRWLVLNHLGPPLPLRYLYPAFLGDADKHFDGRITVGEDGMIFSLPAQDKSIESGSLL